MVIEKCCFCVPLWVATIIIGSLHLVVIAYENFAHTTNDVTHIIDIISISAAIMLIVAAIKKKRYYLVPWMVVMVILCITLAFLAIAAIFQFDFLEEKLSNDIAFKEFLELLRLGYFSVVLLSITIVIILLLEAVIYSFFVELKKQERNPHTRTQHEQTDYTPTGTV